VEVKNTGVFSFLLPTITLAIFGCGSVSKMHHARLERIYRTQDMAEEISKKLQDIEQIMLYVGRIKDGALANMALDVAIAIHGDPDSVEKKYAENITADEIDAMKSNVAVLLKQKAHLEAISSKEKRIAMDEAYSIRGIENRYNFLEAIVTNCTVAIGITAALFFLKKFF
jgi:hypothetical protein